MRILLDESLPLNSASNMLFVLEYQSKSARLNMLTADPCSPAIGDAEQAARWVSDTVN